MPGTSLLKRPPGVITHGGPSAPTRSYAIVVPSIVAVGMRSALYRWPRPAVARETGPVSDALPTVQHWINGRAHPGSSPRQGDVFDPAAGVVAKHVAFAEVGDVDAAVAAARTA